MNKINHVQFFRFAVVLPVAQLFLALAFWAYEPFQLVKEETKALDAVQAERHLPPIAWPPRLGSQSELFRPPLVGKIRYVVNLPARYVSALLSNHINKSPMWGMTWPLGDDPSYPKPGTTVYQIGLEE